MGYSRELASSMLPHDDSRNDCDDVPWREDPKNKVSVALSDGSNAVGFLCPWLIRDGGNHCPHLEGFKFFACFRYKFCRAAFLPLLGKDVNLYALEDGVWRFSTANGLIAVMREMTAIAVEIGALK